MTNTITCDRCKGSGKVKYKHIADGVCFQCEGSGKIKVSNEAYQNMQIQKEKSIATYIKFYEGLITDVLTSSELVEPDKEKGDNFMYKHLTICDNDVLYRTKWNSFTKKDEVYSVSFKVTNYTNTLELVTRLITCHYKDEINLWRAFESTGRKLDKEIIEALNNKILNAENEAIEQLKKFNLTS